MDLGSIFRGVNVGVVVEAKDFEKTKWNPLPQEWKGYISSNPYRIRLWHIPSEWTMAIWVDGSDGSLMTCSWLINGGHLAH